MAHDPDIVLNINGNNHYFRTIKALQFRRSGKVAIGQEVDKDGSSERNNQKKVVVKTLELELPTDGAIRLEVIAMMTESWNRICRLKHPNVLSCTYAVLDEATFEKRFLTGTQIMDYGLLGDLEQYLHSPLLSQDQARVKHFGAQVFSGIHYLHSQFRPIIHGDIKPQNIAVFPDATMKYSVLLKIFDLDHHAVLAASVSQKEGQQVLGTVPYMSPEMIRKPNGRVGRRTDIWSLGCVVVTMLSWPEPFKCAYRGTDFTDPFDPSMKDEPFQTISAMDFLTYGGHAVPYIPWPITDDCQDFLKNCLTVDAQNRATAETLLFHPWIIHEIFNEEVNATPTILLQRQESWPKETDNHPTKEKQWMQGIHCAEMLLAHIIVPQYDRSAFETISQSFLEQIRKKPFSDDQLRMCMQHLESAIPAPCESERKAVQFLPSGQFARSLFPIILSLKTLADFMNNYCHSTRSQHEFSVMTNLVWDDVKHALDTQDPVICQIATNETDQNADVLGGAKMLSFADICPGKLLEFEFVIVHGYKYTKKGVTLVSITRASGKKVTKTLHDFEAAWNWNTSDSLMQKYLMLDEVFPASALFRCKT